MIGYWKQKNIKNVANGMQFVEVRKSNEILLAKQVSVEIRFLSL